MNINEAISRIHAPKGMTSIIAGVMSGDFSSIRDQNAVGASLESARAKLKEVEHAQATCGSDWAYWGYEGDKAYWGATVNILEAASIVGPDNLPDIPAPDVENCVVMDACCIIEGWGIQVLEEAKKSQRTPSEPRRN